MKSIEVENIGPIESLRLPIPDGGGIVCLVGKNGSGKTLALEGVQALLSGRGKARKRDAAASGSISLGGASLTVRKSQQRRGELEVLSLEGKWDVSTLVDPGLQSPEAADSRRIKALVQLSGIGPDIARFAALVGGEENLRKLVHQSAFEGEDLVEVAERVRRDLHAAALERERVADTTRAAAVARRCDGQGVDMSVLERDVQGEYEKAVLHFSALVERKKQFDKSLDAAARARECLEESTEKYQGPSIEAAVEAEQSARAWVERHQERIKQLDAELAQARVDERESMRSYNAAQQTLLAVQRHEALVLAWQQQIDGSADVQTVLGDELVAADESVRLAKLAVETSGAAKRAKVQLEQSEVLSQQATDLAREALQLRDAAKATDDILSEAVAETGSALRVRDGRLVITTGRGETCFADLSAGERWRIALDVAIDAAGPESVQTIKQEAWEGLDYEARKAVWEHALARRALIITAEAPRTAEEDPGEIQAVEYSPAS